MTLPMARDLAPAGIRVMSIAPGLFGMQQSSLYHPHAHMYPALETNMTAKTPPKAKAKILKDAIFPERMGHASEYAMLACHLIENTMMSGEIVRIDGASRLGKL